MTTPFISQVPKMDFARRTGWAMLLIGLMFLLLSLNATAADVTVTTVGGGGGGMIGQDGWNAIKGFWFGPTGLIVGVIIFFIGLHFFFKEGVLALLATFAVGIVFFFLPAIAVAVQNYAARY